MSGRNELVKAIQKAASGHELSQAVAALDAFDQGQRNQAALDRELDLGATLASKRLDPVPTHELHTAATDWVLDVPEPADDGYRPIMTAQASTWYANLDPAVRGDRDEFAEQARGQARTLASAYGSLAPAAEREFLQMAGYLQAQGASGLPQIDQTVDPNNNPSATPYPTETFDNFAPEQDQFNGVEDNNHGSQISSDGAPLIQQVRQQDSSGSGFGSGPERPDEHSTGMDTADSYAEVPLGPPGQIGTTPAATDSQAGSAPNPIAGQPQDAGADRRQTVAGYSPADPFGYRWATDEIVHPFHEKCASAHWPDESCGGRAHVASVAVGYVMDLDKARRVDQCERLGAQAGLQAVQGAANPAELAERHNQVVSGWKAQGQGEDDTAVLHGFCAVVRPVLADAWSRSQDGAGPGSGLDFLDAPRGGQPRYASIHEACSTDPGADHRGDRAVLAEGGRPFADRMLAMAGRSASGGVRGVLAGAENGAGASRGVQDQTRPGPGSRSGAGPYVSPAGDGMSGREGVLASSVLQSGAPAGGNGRAEYQPRNGSRAGSASAGQVQAPARADSGEHHLDHAAQRQAQQAMPGMPQRQAPQGGLIRTARDAPGKCHICGEEADGTCEQCGKGVCDDHAQMRDHSRFCNTCNPRPGQQRQGASSQTQIQQTVDPNNQPTPQDDQLPEGVAFPINPAWSQQWVTGPGGPQPKAGATKEAASKMNGLPTEAAQYFGRMDALEGKQPHNKSSYAFSDKAHGQYLRSWNEVHATKSAVTGSDPLSKQDYGQMTGRPDLHSHWQGHYDRAKAAQAQRSSSMPMTGSRRTAGDSGEGVHPDNDRCSDCGHRRGCDCPHDCDYSKDGFAELVRDHLPTKHEGRRVTADTWSQPRQTTDDLDPAYNSAATTPPAEPPSTDYSAGSAAGRADRAAGQRPAFADNSSAVSPYVKGYAEAYGAPGGPQGPQDVPVGMGGDNGQPMLDQEAQQRVQVAHGSLRRVSAAFAPDVLMGQPDFAKAYRFASRWAEGTPVPGVGSAHFEAGLFAGITDRPQAQQHWMARHAVLAKRHPELATRIDLHAQYSVRALGSLEGFRVEGAYLRTAIKTRRYKEGDEECWKCGDYVRPEEREKGPHWAPVMGVPYQHKPEHQERCDWTRGLSVADYKNWKADQKAQKNQGQQPAKTPAKKTAGVSTDLITDGPGTSPDPMGSTPINGPGTPPPMGGLDQAATPGGAPPYQGAPPMPGGPVVPDPVMGHPQQPSQPDGPFTNTFSGQHPENANLAPAAPDTAAQPGYSNKDAYDGASPDRVAKLAAFRSRVQAGIVSMGAKQ